MSIIQGEDECLRQIVKIRLTRRIVEHLCINRVSIGFQNKLYLSRIYYASVKLCAGVCLCGFSLDILDFSSILRYTVDAFTFKYRSAIFSRLCLDSEHTVVNIDAVCNGFLQRVIDDPIVIKECQCFRCRCCCKTYHLGRTEVVEHLLP